MNKTIMLLLGVAFLSACVVQNIDSEAPVAPDKGFVTSYRNTEVIAGCDEDESNYLLYGKREYTILD